MELVAPDWSEQQQQPKKKFRKQGTRQPRKQIKEKELHDSASSSEDDSGWSSSEDGEAESDSSESESENDTCDSESDDSGSSDSDSESDSDYTGKRAELRAPRKHERKIRRTSSMQSDAGQSRRKKKSRTSRGSPASRRRRHQVMDRSNQKARINLEETMLENRLGYLPQRQLDFGNENIRKAHNGGNARRQRSQSMSHRLETVPVSSDALENGMPQYAVPDHIDLGYEDAEPEPEQTRRAVRSQSISCGANPPLRSKGSDQQLMRRSSLSGTGRRLSEVQALPTHADYTDKDYDDQKAFLANLSRRSIIGRAGRPRRGSRIQRVVS
jgi:hypothetical protein